MRKKPRIWYSISCPRCGRDTTGTSGQAAIKLSKHQTKFMCPHCHTMIDTKEYDGGQK